MNISFFLGIFIPFFKVHFLASLFLRFSKKCFVPKNIAPPEYIPIHTLVWLHFPRPLIRIMSFLEIGKDPDAQPSPVPVRFSVESQGHSALCRRCRPPGPPHTAQTSLQAPGYPRYYKILYIRA